MPNNNQEKRQIINLTDNAAEHIKYLITQREKQTLGIKIGTKNGGCTGLRYTFEYADSKQEDDEEVNDKGVTVLIAKKAILYIIGTTLDYIKADIKSGFIFLNPNAKGHCGCGESFYT